MLDVCWIVKTPYDWN